MTIMTMIRTCGAQTAAFTKDFLDRMATPLAQGHCHDYQVMVVMMMMMVMMIIMMMVIPFVLGYMHLCISNCLIVRWDPRIFFSNIY